MGKGYMGEILWVDLGTRRIRRERIADGVYEKCLSGSGLGAYLLYRRIPAGADPLGPENILGFVSGLLTGTGSLFTGRWMVVGKSPLTGGWGDANCGGNFSPAIKQCGVDGIFFTGVSERPVIFYADSGDAMLWDASDIWGMDTVETEAYLTAKIGGKKKPRVACIGPAGEKRSLISGIVNDGGRIAARSGLGAVMGSKHLKAVVLAGARRIRPANRTAVKALSKQCNEHVQYQPPFLSGSVMAHMGRLMRMLPAQMETHGMLYKFMLKKWGTVSMNQMSIEMGDAPIKNWKGSNVDFGPDKSGRLNPDDFTRSVVAKYFCYSCPLGCGGLTPVKNSDIPAHRPEYETALALGGLCMNEDVESINRMNERLNRAGMDTISVGGTVAFAMECYEKGLITASDTGGLALTWGNTAAMETLVDLMIERRGIGDLLADGVNIAAKKIGKDAMRFAIHSGGQELGMHDGRFDPGFALHNCVEPTPGRHTIGSQLYYEMFRLWKKIKSLPEPEMVYLKSSKYNPGPEKSAAAAACSRYVNVINGAGCCLFGAFLGTERLPLFDWLNAATGWQKTPEDYMAIGDGLQTLKQAFNIKHGIDPRQFKSTDRALGRPPLKQGANKGRSIAIEQMIRDYWQQFGWDARTGRPKPERLSTVGIDST